MAKINIHGVNSGSKSFTVHVVLTDEEMIEDELQVTILGEAFLEFPEGVEAADVRADIIKAGEGILKKHKDSVDKRKDIQEMDFPPIL